MAHRELSKTKTPEGALAAIGMNVIQHWHDQDVVQCLQD
jgi:hypothetical protein